MSAWLFDTSALITLADPTRPHHDAAEAYFREALHQGATLMLSAIAASEFQVRQAVTDLPLRNFLVLPFNLDHAMQAGLLMRQLHQRDPGDDRGAVKDDLKLIAQAICESITHVLTEDARTLVKYLNRLRDQGQCHVQAVLLKDGFDRAWFQDGQRDLLAH